MLSCCKYFVLVCEGWKCTTSSGRSHWRRELNRPAEVASSQICNLSGRLPISGRLPRSSANMVLSGERKEWERAYWGRERHSWGWGEQEVGLGPSNYALSQTCSLEQSNLQLLTPAWLYATFRGGTWLSRRIEAATALPGHSSPKIVLDAAQDHWPACSSVSQVNI